MAQHFVYVLGNLLEEEDEGWGDEDDAHGQQPAALSPVRLIIDQCVSFFDVVFEKRPIPSAELVTKVCEVLRSGLLSLHTSAAPLVDTYLKYLDVFLFHFPASSCELAKAIFLVNFLMFFIFIATTNSRNFELAQIYFRILIGWFYDFDFFCKMTNLLFTFNKYFCYFRRFDWTLNWRQRCLCVLVSGTWNWSIE